MKIRFEKLVFTLLIFAAAFICISCDSECAHRNMNTSLIEPSCGAHGYTVYKCIDCSFSFESDFTEPKAHDLEKTVIAPTCTSSGHSLYECKNCDYSYISDIVAATEHNLSAVILSPTCTKPGYTAVQCLNCKYSYTENQTTPVKHVFDSVVTEASCTKEGFTTHTCSVCSYSYVSDIVCATDHDFTVQVTEPTCLEQGYTTKSCSQCNEVVITEYTVPKGHSYTSEVFRTTSSSDGYKLNTCTDCDYSYKSDIVYSYAVFMGAYTQNSDPIATGIDVSMYNGKLNWTNIASNGIDFAILRAGSSVSGKDTTFDYNYRNARAAGLDVGVYYYADIKSAEEALKCVEELEVILDGMLFEYPIYLDIEKDSLGEELGKELLTEICTVFIETLQARGYFAALYTNNNWLYNFYVTEKIVSAYDVWYARYIPVSNIANAEWDLEKYGTTMGIWQYTNEGTISGESCKFDMNIAYRDYPTIIKRFHYNGY